MGLDMYAYVASRKGQQSDFDETSVFDATTNEFVSDTVTKPVELAYWRKHPNLHGWMEKLWERKGRPRQNVGWPIFNHPDIQLVNSWKYKWWGSSNHEYFKLIERTNKYGI